MHVDLHVNFAFVSCALANIESSKQLGPHKIKT